MEYFTPKTVSEAVARLAELGDRAKIISGGTDLVTRIKDKDIIPAHIINLENISGLQRISHTPGLGLDIGALTSIAALKNSSLIKDKFNIIHQAAAAMATPAVRNQATIGGNLCNAAPSADMAPALIATGAVLTVDGEKTIDVENLFRGPGKTILKPHQLLTSIRVPDPPPHSGGTYLKHTRSRGADLAIVGVAVFVVMDGEIVKDIVIALGAVAPTPVRARKAEAVLKGNKPEESLIEAAARAAAGDASPISDVRASADYRRELVAVLTSRAVAQAVAAAKK